MALIVGGMRSANVSGDNSGSLCHRSPDARRATDVLIQNCQACPDTDSGIRIGPSAGILSMLAVYETLDTRNAVRPYDPP